MMKIYKATFIGAAVISIFTLAMPSIAKGGSQVPEVFQGEDNRSSIEINYDDITAVLNFLVLETGPSTRMKANRSIPAIGTRFKVKKNRYTANEGNRIFLSSLKNPDAHGLLTSIRKSLEAIPDELPLSSLNEKEQIAYWLNLYNISFLEQTAVRRQNNMKNLLSGKNNLLEVKALSVAGINLSLNDIEMKLLHGKWGNNPLLMYGAYKGIIGSPNILKEAFTGRKVFKQLRSIAHEFINSNRGTFYRGGRKFHVSSFYERNSHYFSNFDFDLRRHLMIFLKGQIRSELVYSKSIIPDVNDWTVASMTGNTRVYGDAYNTNASALATATINSTNGVAYTSGFVSSLADLVMTHPRFTPQQVEFLLEIKKKRQLREGQVQIDEVN